MHQEEHVVGEVMFILDVSLKSMRHFIEVVLANATYEAGRLQVLLDLLQLISELSKGVNDQTLDDGKQDNDDKEEESDVEEDAPNLVRITVRRLYLITYASSCSYTHIQVEYVTSEHVVALVIHFSILVFNVELSEEDEGNDSVHVYNNTEQQYSQHQLFAIVCYRGQDGAQRLEADSHIQQMGGKEEIVEVAEQREGEVPDDVQEGVVGEDDTPLPNLILPVQAGKERRQQGRPFLLTVAYHLIHSK